MTATEPRTESDLTPGAAGPVCGPQLPTMEDLHAARDARWEANLSDAAFGQLTLQCQQTEIGYLHGYERDLIRALETEPEAEAEI